MSVIIEFNEQEKQQLIKNCKKAKNVGEGSESICYQIDDHVYKIIRSRFRTPYNANKFYNDELDLESFLFPEEIYVSNNMIFATKTKYVENEMYRKRIFAGILPDINKIKEALPSFIKDFYTLSRNNVLAVDISWENILFDGEKLYAIDTLHYTINDEHFQVDAYKWNINFLEQAMFKFTLDYEGVCKKKRIPLSEENLKTLHELPLYIKKVAEQVKNKNEYENIQKIKR